ncbi:ABC transporter ATP-binding protein [Agromyces archimandritae]|uniref:ABC transporter ATP-binding protein n=1 Tax=Agromyces archimandritae TaxID=2781962 RepID=A0A975INB2_9MICO|nr:ABC transporter ATP-binding protein [Agromyces archimandritae]QTX04069.1 ABC transporter ATP-binding protein [Agromyces archimandritae]
MTHTDPIAASARDVSLAIGRKRILEAVDLTVERGSFHGIIGPNGAGKSTLFDVLLGFRAPSGGEVRLLGRAPRPRSIELLARVGIQPQRTAFFPKLTAIEHLEAIADLFGASHRRIDTLMEALDLGPHARTRAEKLSGGERQRLAIASALVHEPEVLFLDEPTAGLDPGARRNLVELLRGADLSEMTTIYTTHYLEEAERLCDVVTILDGGRTLVTKSPAQLIGEARLGVSILLPAALHQADLAAGLPSVTGIDVGDDGVTVRTVDTARAFADLAGAGVDTANAQVRGGSLEDVFLTLTGRSYEA